MTKDQSEQNNVVQFPVAQVKLARAKRAYEEEIQRWDRLVYEGKPARLNKRIKQAYWAARREAGWGFR